MSTWTGQSRHKLAEPTFEFGLSDDVPADPDPLDPHPEHPTPIELVVRLTNSERVTRVKRLTQMAWNRYDQAIDSLAGKRVAGICSLVSGGNDSYTVAHLFRPVTTHHVHANTGTGIEATRQFVRETAKAWGIPLLEVHGKPGEGYFDLVRGTVMARSRETGELVQCWPGGYPGPAAHAIMFQRLKQRGLEQVPHHFGISGSRTDRVVYIAGRRRPESKRRATVPHFESKGTVLWSSPLAVWHKADLRAYRLLHRDVPVNPVTRVLGMSGECGCLANAVAEERERWFAAYPEEPFILAIQAMEAELADRADIPEHRKVWGWGGAFDEPDEVIPFDGPSVCSVNCGPDPLFDAMDPLFDLDLLDGAA